METGDLAHADGTAPPGEYLEEVIRKLGLSKNELARRMNRPAAKLSAIFKGTKAITPVTALQLEKVVGVDARVWTGLEADYRLALARAREVEDWDRLVEEGLRVGRFPYAGLAELGWVEPKSRLGERVMELQRFFGVTSLRNLSAIRLYACGMRRVGSGEGRASPEAVCRMVEDRRAECPAGAVCSFQENRAQEGDSGHSIHAPGHLGGDVRCLRRDPRRVRCRTRAVPGAPRHRCSRSHVLDGQGEGRGGDACRTTEGCSVPSRAVS